MLQRKNIKIRINDIDANLHVNNARYFDFAFSELGMEFLKEHQLKQSCH